MAEIYSVSNALIGDVRTMIRIAGTKREDPEKSLVKRLLDVIGAALALVLFSPLMLLVAIAVRCTIGRSIFYRQSRPGLHGEIFQIIKFRTMRDGRDTAGRLLPDEFRITRLGGWLRQFSLDELPELLNVLRGEMSLVGPRPLMI